jgi:hypothetical protein
MGEETGEIRQENAQKLISQEEIKGLELFIDKYLSDEGSEYQLTTVRGKSVDGHDLRIHWMSSLPPRSSLPLYLRNPESRRTGLVGFRDEEKLTEKESVKLFGKYTHELGKRNEMKGKSMSGSYYMPQHEDPWRYFEQVLSKPNFGKPR